MKSHPTWAANLLKSVCLVFLASILPTVAVTPTGKKHLREAHSLVSVETQGSHAVNVSDSEHTHSRGRGDDPYPEISDEMNELMREKPEKKQELMNAIDAFRAKVCADMHAEMGVDFDSFEKCKKFMAKACHPGKDGQMDGDRKEITSGQGYCQQFFPKAEEEAKKEVEAEEVKEVKANPVADDPAVELVPAPGPGHPGAPSPGMSGAPLPAPGPAPAPGPFVPGVSKGQPPIPPKKDEAWYYSKDGKDAEARVHMTESLKLPAQGYWGKLVEHEDGETATGDWMKEFGPQATHETYASICRKHPENPWCTEQGYHRWTKGAAVQQGPFSAALILALAMLLRGLF